MTVKWTLHDCWAFTGHCAHFTYVGCDKWKNGCDNCPQKKVYPSGMLFDNSEETYHRKKEAFSGVKNLTLIVPSEWLKKLVEQSFLNEYKIEVFHNAVNRSVFKPTESDFREKFDLKGKIIVLGVASVWNSRKGFDDLIELSGILGDKYKVVMVGLNDKQINKLCKFNIINSEIRLAIMSD